MLYIWVKYDNEFEPHMSFSIEDKEDALFEIQDLEDQGHKAKFGRGF